MHKNNRIGLLLIVLLAMLALSFLITCEKGGQPIAPTTDTNQPDTTNLPPDIDTVVWQAGQMHIICEPSQLLATYNDTSRVTVVAYDNYHHPIVGHAVTFWTNVGIINPGTINTDANGAATVKFTSVPVNTEAIIIARLQLTKDSVIQRNSNITLSGLQVNVRPQTQNVLLNGVVPVRIDVTDAAGKPVANDSLFLSGDKSGALVTLGNGAVNTSVTRATQGSVRIIATSKLGASDTATVNFWTTMPDTVNNTQDQIRQMRIFSSRAQLNADNSDFAQITVILINSNNNPAAGDSVFFACDIGVIGRAAVVDSLGRATVILQSAPINGTCTIRATASSTKDTVSTQVLFGGISLHLTAEPSHLKINTYAQLEALLRNASNMPIGGDMVTFTVSGGATFESGNTLERQILSPEGKAQIRVTSASAGTAVIYATTLNTSDSTSVVFTNNALTLSTSAASIPVGGLDSVTLTAHYVDGSNHAKANVPILFATNAGVIRTLRDTTDANGNAVTVLLSADFATVATVEAIASDASASQEVTFLASTAAHLSLAVTPDNIQVNGGVATLIATVTDAQGNRVSGASVNFKIVEGPGGGEYIEKPLVTSKDGEASTRLFSGSVPSQLLGTKIAAYIGAIADTSKLTISGEPYAISIARPQSDTIRVDDAGAIDSAVFHYYMGAVVKDINGNPVADGTEVHFSAVVCGMVVNLKTFDHWAGAGSNIEEIKPVYNYFHSFIPFEDINNNFHMDEGIDLKLDFNDIIAARGDDVNGDGVCDYNPQTYDFWWDFNGNGVCDPGVSEQPYVSPAGDTAWAIYQDLNGNGARDTSELLIDHNGNGLCDLPASGDFRFSLWEGLTSIFSRNFRFDTNDFAVVIDKSAVTQGGVAHVNLTYPRQYARKLTVLVDAEVQGVRDSHTEPFTLVVIVKN